MFVLALVPCDWAGKGLDDVAFSVDQRSRAAPSTRALPPRGPPAAIWRCRRWAPARRCAPSLRPSGARSATVAMAHFGLQIKFWLPYLFRFLYVYKILNLITLGNSNRKNMLKY